MVDLSIQLFLMNFIVNNILGIDIVLAVRL